MLVFADRESTPVEPLRTEDRRLPQNEDVRQWYENLAARSLVTSSVYLRALGLHCDMNRTAPREILSASRGKIFRDEFADLVSRPNSYSATCWATVGLLAVPFERTSVGQSYPFMSVLKQELC